jgi:cobalt/nickel transport protein
MRGIPTRTVLGALLLVTLVLAGIVSYYASSSPDGLERVAEEHGFSGAAEEHPAAGSPMADYQANGVDDSRLSGGAAGVVGSVVVLALAGGLTLALRRRGSDQEPAVDAAGSRPDRG